MGSGLKERSERKSLPPPMQADVIQAVEVLRRALLSLREANRELAAPVLRETDRQQATRKRNEATRAIVQARADLDTVLIGDDL